MRIDLSDGEWKLMDRLWDHAPMTIMELTAAMKPVTGWSKNTVITMLDRLAAKGAVTYETEGRARQYRPLVPREEAALKETENFLDKVFGGSLGLMMSAMVERNALSREDIAQLSAILDKAGGEQK